jgi:hypothetical protein
LPKSEPHKQRVEFEQIWIWERANEEDLKYVMVYSVDLENGPQLDIQTETGGPFLEADALIRPKK